MDFSSFITKLIDTGINRKNFIIVIVGLFCFVCWALGINIQMIKQFFIETNLDFLLISLFLYELIIGICTINKLDTISEKKELLDGALDILSKNSENSDIIKSKLEDINNSIKCHDKRFINATSDIVNKPNIKQSKILISSDINNIFYDILIECIKYTLIVDENNNDIAIENMKNNIYSSVKEKISYIHDTIKIFDTSETLSENIKDKIYKIVDVIVNDIQKNKKTNEKLRIIDYILKESKEEIKQIISNYIREIQTKIFD